MLSIANITDRFRYICDICGAGLKRKEHLERHKLGKILQLVFRDFTKNKL